MSGIFFFGVIGIYLYVVVKLSGYVAKAIERDRLKPIGRGVFVVLLLALPLADEIVGAFQFNALCKEGAVLKIDAEKAKGKTARLVIDPSNEVLPDTALLIYHSRYRFFDTGSGSEIGMFDEFVAKGGVLIRLLGISNNTSPILLGKPWCSPPLSVTQMQKKYAFTVVEQHLGEGK